VSEASEKKFAAALDFANAKKDLKLVWFSTGSQEFPLGATKNTIARLEGHGFKVEYHERGGGHTWENWRDYLHQFPPRLFNN
jgi:enterochelin esterase family protein